MGIEDKHLSTGVYFNNKWAEDVHMGIYDCKHQGLVHFLAGKRDVHVTAVLPHKGKREYIQAVTITWQVRKWL